MEICSPKDGFVLEVLVKQGAHVAAGAPLLQMDTVEEDKRYGRISTMVSVRQALIKKYTGEQLEFERQIAKAAVDIAQKVVDAYKKILDDTESLVPYGRATMGDVKKVEVDYEKAQGDLVIATANQKRLEFSAAQQQSVFDEVKAQLDSELGMISDQKKKMKIIAPISGKVSLHVGAGSFAETGFTLLDIE